MNICTKFKPEVLAALMLTLISLVLCLSAILSDNWIQGELTPKNTTLPISDFWNVTFSYGLFKGKKVRHRSDLCAYDLQVVCSGGYCMLSCATGDAASQDIEDIIGSNSQDIFSGDRVYCGECQSAETSYKSAEPEYRKEIVPELIDDLRGLSKIKIRDRAQGIVESRDNLVNIYQDQSSTTSPSSTEGTTGEPTRTAPVEEMLSFGLWISTLIFFFAGMVLATLVIILCIINLASNPISFLFGVDGLVVWSASCALLQFICLALWGSAFASTLTSNVGISDTLRYDSGGAGWVSEGNAQLGYGYWLLIPVMFLHIFAAVILGYRQYKRYYAPKSRKARNLEMRVQDRSAGGNDMIF